MRRFLIATAAAAIISIVGVASVYADGGPLARSDVELKMTEIVKTKNGKEKRHGRCSGVYLGKGVILTDKHCVADNPVSISVVLDLDGVEHGEFSATVLSLSEKHDIALLKVADDLPAQAAELACRAPVIGEPLELVGNPLGQFFIHTWGRVAGVMRDPPDADKSGEELFYIPVDMEIASGNSGGPAYDKDGKVLGLADLVIEGLPQGGAGQVRMLISSLAACGEVAVARANTDGARG